MGTDNVIFVGEQWGATGSHVTETDVTGSRVTARFLNRLYELACSGVTRIIQSLYYALLYYPAIVPIEGAVLFELVLEQYTINKPRSEEIYEKRKLV
jgi:hypothetical protein